MAHGRWLIPRPAGPRAPPSPQLSRPACACRDSCRAFFILYRDFSRSRRSSRSSPCLPPRPQRNDTHGDCHERQAKALPPFLMKASQPSRADGASTIPSRTISNIPTSRPTSPWQSQGPGADTLLLACRQKTHGSHVDWTEWGGSHHPPSTVDLSKRYTRHARVSLAAGTQLDRRLGDPGGVTALGDGYASPSRYPSPKRYPSPTVRFADRRAPPTAAPSSPPSRDNIGRLQTMIAHDHRQLSACSRALRRWAEAAATKPTRVRWLAEGWLPPGAGRRAALFARWRCRTCAG